MDEAIKYTARSMVINFHITNKEEIKFGTLCTRSLFDLLLELYGRFTYTTGAHDNAFKSSHHASFLLNIFIYTIT